LADIATRNQGGLDISHLSIDDETRVLRLDGLVIDDPEIYLAVSSRPSQDRLPFLKRAIKIGIIALRDAVVADRVDYVEKHFQQFENRLQEVFQKNLGSDGLRGELDKIFGEKGELQSSLAGIFGEDGKLTRELLDPENPNTPLGRLRKSVEACFVGKDSELYSMLDPHKRDSPVNRLRQEILEALTDIKMDLQRYFVSKQVESTTPKRGERFEDDLWVFLNRIAGPFGDSIERVGKVYGEKAEKKGDFVVSLYDLNSEDESARIVVEAKARSEPLTLTRKGILGELDEAMKNRNAEFGIAVAEESLPKEAGAFREFENNKIVCAFTGDGLPLEVAYKIGRAKVLMRKRIDTRAEVDIPGINGLVEKISTDLRTFQGIKAKLTKVGELSDEAKTELDIMKDSIQQSLIMIARALVPVVKK